VSSLTKEPIISGVTSLTVGRLETSHFTFSEREREVKISLIRSGRPYSHLSRASMTKYTEDKPGSSSILLNILDRVINVISP
jgi:hypothetical protein